MALRGADLLDCSVHVLADVIYVHEEAFTPADGPRGLTTNAHDGSPCPCFFFCHCDGSVAGRRLVGRLGGWPRWDVVMIIDGEDVQMERGRSLRSMPRVIIILWSHCEVHILPSLPVPAIRARHMAARSPEGEVILSSNKFL